MSPRPDDLQLTSSYNARAAVVNRTHRVVRARAAAMQASRRRGRDLILPLLICSALLLTVCYAVWAVVGQDLEQEADRLMTLGSDIGGQFYVLLLWFLPVSAITVAVAVLRRSQHSDRGMRDEGMRG